MPFAGLPMYMSYCSPRVLENPISVSFTGKGSESLTPPWLIDSRSPDPEEIE